MPSPTGLIDLRSDTVTHPTPEMREAMYRAEVGDDVYGEDPTVNRLEEIAAAKVGKEAAVYVTSGTMGNIVSLLSQTTRGQEIICEAGAHIFVNEVANLAMFGGCQMRAVKGHYGAMNPDEVEAAIRAENVHYPRTALIAHENTNNAAGGTLLPLDYLAKIKNIAENHGLKVHIDGARLFNAAAGLGVEPKEITKYADSVQCCLSKGLCAPIGGFVAGTKEFAKEARRYRKALGGGLRQSGITAAAGIIAIEKMSLRLGEDHARAKRLATGLAEIPGMDVDMGSVQTNIIRFGIKEGYLSAPELAAKCKEKGILFGPQGQRAIRMVTHYYISDADVEKTLEATREAMAR